jgi:hypothetical protein
MQQSRASRFHCSERPTKLNQQLLRPFNHRTLQQSHRKHSTMEGDYALPNMAEQHMRSQSFDAPQVTMETDGHFGDDGPGGMMQYEDSLFADASMADVGDMYGLGDTLSQAPYYGIPQVDPDLSQLFDDDMADVDLQADSNDVSPTQASLTPGCCNRGSRFAGPQRRRRRGRRRHRAARGRKRRVHAGASCCKEEDPVQAHTQESGAQERWLIQTQVCGQASGRHPFQPPA